jgi:hypothetical protein
LAAVCIGRRYITVAEEGQGLWPLRTQNTKSLELFYFFSIVALQKGNAPVGVHKNERFSPRRRL